MSEDSRKSVNSDVNSQIRAHEGISAEGERSAAAGLGGAASIDVLGREQQRRATAWARARGQA